MQIGIVIPTYNEVDNLSGLVRALITLPLDLRLLVVDDNSPDGTGQIAEELSVANSKRMTVLHRTQKLGLASACIQGFRYFLEKGVDAVGQMDADFSHDPNLLTTMAKRLESCDLVLGSRYVREGRVDKSWPSRRKYLSAWGNLYARLLLRLPVRDVTTGYRLWRSETLKGMPLERIRSKGYVFQVEIVYLAYRLGYDIAEVPIFFTERRMGKTKMSYQIQFEAALRIWQMLFIYRDIHRSDLITSAKGTY